MCVQKMRFARGPRRHKPVVEHGADGGAGSGITRPAHFSHFPLARAAIRWIREDEFCWTTSFSSSSRLIRLQRAGSGNP